MRWRSRNPDDTRRLAAGLGRALAECAEEFSAGAPPIGLCGPLGAGKTEFVRGVVEGLGADPRLVQSPTFVIASEYPVRCHDQAWTLIHADFYRLQDETELEGAGFLDWLRPGVILCAEWADRFEGALPRDHLLIELERETDGAKGAAQGEGPSERWLAAHATGLLAERCLDAWRKALAPRPAAS